MRAGDADRDRIIGQLQEAFAEGRLTQDEFEQRLESAQQSKTFADLELLTADLPRMAPAPVDPKRKELEKRKADLRKGWAAWVGVSVLVNVIWGATALTSMSLPSYWPIWVMGPWGAAMLIGTLALRADRGPTS
jgi:hypothetical protein